MIRFAGYLLIGYIRNHHGEKFPPKKNAQSKPRTWPVPGFLARSCSETELTCDLYTQNNAEDRLFLRKAGSKLFLQGPGWVTSLIPGNSA